ncbi:DUF1837 domain-containing protein [Fructilactobacillus cliffordii]|uniref:DUF1837 domain-containing protein n=1 Tax=Fructilactobacillus cliffordii TaxID=2940299 RepID=A0A9Q8ZVN7_9LACO|nr:DUF1837 domain-containing protein [Fructilactobacillus cliffordii]USS89366.1 DUF1837 domain-containing protein [Fructilactobacillus cliffordii]
MCRKTTDLINSFEYAGSLYLFEDTPKKTEIKIYSPSILNKQFNYESLIDQLMDINIYYSLTYNEISRLKADDKLGFLSRLARSKFREYSKNDGESGEILLYSFLEGDLKAPKILSKMSLKTNPNLYVFGADGVHFFVDENNKYHIIYGEAKMYKRVSLGLTKAFDSIGRFISNYGTDAKLMEDTLIRENVTKEKLTDEQKQKIIEIVYPSPKQNTINYSDDFGIFIGYEISIKDDWKLLSDDEFRKLILKESIEKVNNQLDKIQNLIKKYNLISRDFYFYMMPFTEIGKTRKKIIEGITK